MYTHPTIHQELARHRHADVLREARDAQLKAHLAAEKEPVAALEGVRGVLGRLAAYMHRRPVPVRPVVKPA